MAESVHGDERDKHENRNISTSSTSRKDKLTDLDSYRRHIDRLLLLHFFLLFGASFVLGLLFLHSSLSFWRFQGGYQESGFFENLFESAAEDYQQQEVVNVVTFNPNLTFSVDR